MDAASFHCTIPMNETCTHQGWIMNDIMENMAEQEQNRQRTVEAALAEVEKINNSLREEMAVSTALSREYSSLFQIDAKTGKITLYRTDGIGMDSQMLERLMQMGNY